MHQLPSWFGKACVAMTLVIEIGVPWLIFCGRRGRLAAFVLLVALQLAIAWTGNYGFFNLLTLVLCVALLDDRQIERVLPDAVRAPAWARPPRAQIGEIMRGGSWAATAARPARDGAGGGEPARHPARAATHDCRPTIAPARVGAALRVERGEAPAAGAARCSTAIAPFHSVNGYGLFRSMTTARPEIVIEAQRRRDHLDRDRASTGSPGTCSAGPRLVAPHQPRLDWQMWFAALDPGRTGWLAPLLRRLLEGEPAVLELLDAPEWKAAPPRYVRLRYYRYEFTDAEERAATGAWWRREPIGDADRAALARGHRSGSTRRVALTPSESTP